MTQGCYSQSDTAISDEEGDELSGLRHMRADFIVDPAGGGTHAELQSAIDDVPGLAVDAEEGTFRPYVIQLAPGYNSGPIIIQQTGFYRAFVIRGEGVEYQEWSFGVNRIDGISPDPTRIPAITVLNDGDNEIQHLALVGLKLPGGIAIRGRLTLDVERCMVEDILPFDDDGTITNLGITSFRSLLGSIDVGALSDDLNDGQVAMEARETSVTTVRADTLQGRMLDCRVLAIHARQNLTGFVLKGGQHFMSGQFPFFEGGDPCAAWIKVSGGVMTDVLIEPDSLVMDKRTGSDRTAMLLIGEGATARNLRVAGLGRTNFATHELVGVQSAAASASHAVDVEVSFADTGGVSVVPKFPASGLFDDSKFGPNIPDNMDVSEIVGENNAIHRGDMIGTVDPGVGAGVAAPLGTTYRRILANSADIFVKTGPLDVDWTHSV